MTTNTEDRFGIRARIAACTTLLLLWAVPLECHALFNAPDYYETKLLAVYSLPLLTLALITALFAGDSMAAHPWRWSFGAALVAVAGMALLYFTVIPAAVAFIAAAALTFPMLLKLMLLLVGTAAKEALKPVP